MESERNMAELKKQLRSEIRRRAERMTVEEISESSDRIRAEVLSSGIWREAASMFLYVSVGREPDTRELIRRAVREGKRVFLPKCLPGPERIMLAVRIESAEDLIPGALSIPEPRFDPGNPPETAGAGELDLILAPCVTANRLGERLGHGAGYYDRFLSPLARLRREGKAETTAVCLCHEALLTEEIPEDRFDVRLDGTVTGDGRGFFKKR